MSRRLVLPALASTFVFTIALLGSPVARAADPDQKVARLGIVGPNSPSTDPRTLTAFWGRMRELGWIEGQNLVIEERAGQTGGSVGCRTS